MVCYGGQQDHHARAAVRSPAAAWPSVVIRQHAGTPYGIVDGGPADHRRPRVARWASAWHRRWWRWQTASRQQKTLLCSSCLQLAASRPPSCITFQKRRKKKRSSRATQESNLGPLVYETNALPLVAKRLQDTLQEFWSQKPWKSGGGATVAFHAVLHHCYCRHRQEWVCGCVGVCGGRGAEYGCGCSRLEPSLVHRQTPNMRQ